MTPLDQYIQSQVGPMLQPGEQVYHSSTMRRQPGLLMQMLLVGGLLLALMTKVYFVVLTNRRLILIRTKGSFWSGTPKPLNLGVEQYDVSTFKKVTTSGFANNRSMTFIGDTTKLKLRISPWFKSVSGTKDFFEQVPNLINSGQLAHAQLAAPPPQYGAAPQAQQYGAAPQAQYGAPPQAQQYGAPPQQQAYAAPAPPHYQQPYAAAPALGPGARVLVLAQDGQRYPGTVVQLQGEHCLCAMQNGQFWFPAGVVSPG
ncbi:MAG: hypothetical protein ABUL60_09900 [Myxococcales bacterium]